jgi:putative tricarboxylic transport membrane protein
MIIGVTTGVIFGAIPGLTGGIAIAITLPFTFYMSAVEGLSLLAGIYVGGTFGGSIASILFGTPGSPEAAVTVVDGYPLAQKGYPSKALNVALYASAFSSMLSSFIMIFLSLVIAAFALMIGPPEFFSIVLFSLVLISTLGMGTAWYKGLIAVSLGAIASLVGSDPISSVPRFTFNIMELSSGLSLIPVLVGLFVGSEIIGQTGKMVNAASSDKAIAFGRKDDYFSVKEFRSLLPVMVRGSVVGSIIGALPGLNAAVSAMVNYSITKRVSRNPEKFGTGCLEGIAAAESGHNGTVGPTLCPLLTLGIPGSGTAALFLGAMLMQGVTPGPEIVTLHPDIVYGLFYAFFFSAFILIGVGKVIFLVAKFIPLIPLQIINPCIVLFCVSGSFAVGNQVTDVYVLLFFMTVGYFMRLGKLPIIPLLIGYLLCSLLEMNFRRTMLIYDDNFSVFITKPISLIFLLGTLGLLCWVWYSSYKTKVTPESYSTE